jgi:hypothetical protein
MMGAMSNTTARFVAVLALLGCAATANAQVTATWTEFGAGCPGTGTGLGATQVLPAAANSAWGSGNAIPFGWTPNRFQQVVLGSELPGSFTIAAVSLRQPHNGPVAHNFTVDLEIRVAYTTRWLPTLSTTFASNYDAGVPVTVLPRTLVVFPDQPAGGPQQFTQMLMTIPWQTTFAWVPQPGRNLLVEFVVYGNSVGGGIYGYPIDNLSGTVAVYGTPENATFANGGVRSFAPVLGLVALTATAVPHLYSDDTPQVGNTFRVRVAQAAPSTAALFAIGLSNTTWSGQPLPFDLGGYGAPGCAVLVAPIDTRLVFTDAAGQTNLQYSLPNVLYALGVAFHDQAVIADPAANPLGIVLSNGGTGVIGNQ